MKDALTIQAGGGKEVFVRIFGEGKNLIIALHGYGKTGSYFQPLSTLQSFQVWAPDLPFHGKTRWEGDFTLWDLIDLVDRIRRAEGARSFILLGHSMGARFALAASGGLIPWLEGLVLLAPDGLVTSGLGWISRISKANVGALERSMQNPTIGLWIIASLRKWGLISQAHGLFLQKQLGSPSQRMRLFATWRAVVDAASHLPVARKMLPRTDIPVFLAWGTEDPLIREKKLGKWIGGVPQVRILNYTGGHDPNWYEILPFLERLSE